MSREGSPQEAEPSRKPPPLLTRRPAREEATGQRAAKLPGNSPERSVSDRAESRSISRDGKGNVKAGSGVESAKKRGELDAHRAEEHPRKRHCKESSSVKLDDGQGCSEYRRWDELLSDIDTLRKVDTATFFAIMDATLSAAAPYPDVVRNLSQALVLYSTDKEASLKLLDETKSAQSLLFMANGSNDSRNAAKQANLQIPCENHRSRTPVEGIADRVRSSSEQSVVSEEMSWQDILKKATEAQDLTESRFNQYLQAALQALRSNKNGSDSSAAVAVENLMETSAPLHSRIQDTRKLLGKHYTPATPQPHGTRVESVHLKAGVDILCDLELRLLLQGWKKEISLDHSSGHNTIVAHYIHPSGKKRYSNLADVRTLSSDGHIVGASADTVNQEHEDRLARSQKLPTSGSLLASLAFPRATPESLGLAACLAGSQQDGSGLRSSMRPPPGIQSMPTSTGPVLTTVLSRTPFSTQDAQFLAPGVRLVTPQPRHVLQVVNPLNQDAPSHVVKIPPNGAVAHGGQVGGSYVVQQRGTGRFAIEGDGRRGQQVVVIPNPRILNHGDQQPILRVYPQRSSEHSGQQGMARMVQPYPTNAPVFRTDGRLHTQGQTQQASYTDISQSLNDSLHKDPQPVRLQQAPQPVVIKQGGREHVVLLSPSSHGGRSSQQHRMQTQAHHHQHLHHQQQQQHQQMQGARASLTSNALVGSQIIQTRNDQLIVLPKASSSIPVMQSMGVSGIQGQASSLHPEPGTHGVNVVMTPSRSGTGKGTFVNLQPVQEPGSQGNKYADRRHASSSGVDSAGNSSGHQVHIRGPGATNATLISRGQVSRQLGGDHGSEIHILDSTNVPRATADDKLSRHLEGGRGGTGSYMSNIQKLLRVPASDRHQHKQDAQLGGSGEPTQSSAPTCSRVNAAAPLTTMSESPSDADGLPAVSKHSTRGDKGTMQNGVSVLVKIPPESDGNEHQGDFKIQVKADIKSERLDSSKPEEREACDAGQSSPEAETQGCVNWKCILRSKPTPQRSDMELFTVVGHIDQDLMDKLPDRMTVEEFEAQEQVDCWPTKETITLHLDEETSDRGKHALQRLSDLRLAAIVHLPSFDVVFVPQTQNGDSSLLGLVKPSRVKEEAEEEEDEGSEEGMNNIHGS